uniref:Uncharacterized protein n=1 Tax=Lymantria dispar multicapsid nuclear polyhedrosis virus TaxID=10449 RepID=A0A7S8F9X2_NPVLD|nr:hypothetical protein [Lymantria dispar multiple nucleopolyhedrovirus]QPD02128.1 hypothetical protein [Lymantria dispar multiple nucleopolyhedrovirus]
MLPALAVRPVRLRRGQERLCLFGDQASAAPKTVQHRRASPSDSLLETGPLTRSLVRRNKRLIVLLVVYFIIINFDYKFIFVWFCWRSSPPPDAESASGLWRPPGPPWSGPRAA